MFLLYWIGLFDLLKIITYLSTPGGLTGAPRRLLSLASILRKAGIDVCLASQSGSELLQAAQDQGHETALVDSAGLLALRQGALFGGGLLFRLKLCFDLLRQNLRLFRCIRQKKGDAVWLRGSKGVAFGALGVILCRRPLIWDVDYELPSRGVVRWLHRLGLWASKAVVFQYTNAPDQIFGRVLAEQYRHKFRAIIPGIDLPSLSNFAEQRREKVQMDNGPFVLLQVGTICDRKNQTLILEALQLAREEGLGVAWELWLAYDEIQEPGFEQRVREYGLENNVRLLGWRDDVKELMTQASLLVMPSKDEGVPNAVQEAMAIGLPVLVSRVGGMPEIVSDGKTGWVLDVEDPDAWAHRICWCHYNRKENEAIGQNASAYAFKYFGTEHWGAEYARIIAGQLPHHRSKGES